jgi:hypothetical protein
MQPLLLSEYRNQNGQRNYPFGDEATLTDADGSKLPTDFLLDAFIYSIDLQAGLYLSEIDLQAQRIYLAEDGTGRICGYADYTDTSATAYVYDDESLTRQIGVLVFGPGLSQLFLGNQTRTFTYAATQFCPTAYIALNQSGVRGVKIPDGTIFTGDVLIEGTNGIVVSSYVDPYTAVQTLYVDIVGVPAPTPEDCGDTNCPNVRTINFERMPGSMFMISQYDGNIVGITAYGFTQTELCDAQKAKNLPDKDGNLPDKPKTGDDPCGDEPTPPTPPTPGAHVSFALSLSALHGNVMITTPSSPGVVNPVVLVEMAAQGKQDLATLNLGKVRNVADSEHAIQEFVKPPQFTNGLAIGIKGLAQYRRRGAPDVRV